MLFSNYSFNNQEHDDEIAGDGNSMTAEFWQYDARLGRRWNLDPITETDISHYACFANSPIYHYDLNGDKITPENEEVAKDIKLLKKDKEFRKQYRQWKKESRGREVVIHSDNTKSNVSLNALQIPAASSKKLSDLKDHVYYDGTLSKRSVNVLYKDDVKKALLVGNGGFKNELTFETKIPPNIFDKWDDKEISISPKGDLRYGFDYGGITITEKNIKTPRKTSTILTLMGDHDVSQIYGSEDVTTIDKILHNGAQSNLTLNIWMRALSLPFNETETKRRSGDKITPSYSKTFAQPINGAPVIILPYR